MPLSIELRDPELRHQIILEHDGNTRSSVTCNCWPLTRIGRRKMGSADTIEGCWAIYNDPKRHNVEFTDEWRRPR